MNSIVDDIRVFIIGVTNSFYKVGYGGKLRLGFGEKIYYDPIHSKDKFLHQINISSINSAWRITKDEEFLCASDDESKHWEKVLTGLTLGKVIEFVEISKFDIRIMFDSGFSIDFFCQSTDSSNLFILDYQNKIYYELFSDGWEQSDYKYPVNKLTKIDEVLSTLSEECQERWQNLIPQKDGENECDTCFYFRSISGYFNFWNYGICSNGQSTYDGNLVGFRSGCSKHKELKELT